VVATATGIARRLDSHCGKTMRGTRSRSAGLSALHLVSAWAADTGLTLGQVAVDSKSNEITAIPQTARMVDLKDKIVTIDAMGCQKEIAEQIVGKRETMCWQSKTTNRRFMRKFRRRLRRR